LAQIGNSELDSNLLEFLPLEIGNKDTNEIVLGKRKRDEVLISKDIKKIAKDLKYSSDTNPRTLHFLSQTELDTKGEEPALENDGNIGALGPNFKLGYK